MKLFALCLLGLMMSTLPVFAHSNSSEGSESSTDSGCCCCD